MEEWAVDCPPPITKYKELQELAEQTRQVNADATKRYQRVYIIANADDSTSSLGVRHLILLLVKWVLGKPVGGGTQILPYNTTLRSIYDKKRVPPP